MACRNCDAPVTADDNFCLNCGADLRALAPVGATRANHTDEDTGGNAVDEAEREADPHTDLSTDLSADLSADLATDLGTTSDDLSTDPPADLSTDLGTTSDVVAAEADTDPDGVPTSTTGGAAGPGRGESPGLVPCPRCGSPNSARRPTCAKCRSPLHPAGGGAGREADGDSDDDDHRSRSEPVMSVGAARTARRPAHAPEFEVRQDVPPRGGHPVVWILLVAVILGAVIGGMYALGVGPFGRTEAAEEPAPVAFRAADYPPEPGGLELTSATATTERAPSGNVGYAAALLIDGDLSTAWNNDGSRAPEGIGERVVLTPPSPIWLTEIVLANGYQRDDTTFMGNGRLRTLRLVLDGGRSFQIALLDRRGRQSVRLDGPVLTTTVTLEAVEAYAGDTYEDLAVSEIELSGYVADTDDRAAAEARTETG